MSLSLSVSVSVCICPCVCVYVGRECEGIHFAVNYLETWQKKQSGRTDVDDLSVSARDKRVVVIGGGDTGVDCIATALRQACSQTQTDTHGHRHTGFSVDDKH